MCICALLFNVLSTIIYTYNLRLILLEVILIYYLCNLKLTTFINILFFSW